MMHLIQGGGLVARTRKLTRWDDLTAQGKRRFITTWSATKLKQFHTCPLQFFFTYIEPQEYREWIRRLFGSAIHNMLNRFFRYRYKDSDTFIGAWKYLWFIQLSREYSDNAVRWDTDNPHEERGNYFGRGVNILRTFWNENISVRNSPYAPQTEHYFSFGFFGYRLHGYIDRRQPLPEGGITITDYKTGRGRYTDAVNVRDLQFTFYQLAEEVLMRRKPKELWIHRLDDNTKIPITLRNNGHYELLLAYLDEAQAYLKKLLYTTDLPRDTLLYHMNPGALDRHIFMPRSGPQCNWCEFERVCSARQREALGQTKRCMAHAELEHIASREPQPIPQQLNFPITYKRKRKHLEKKDTALERHKRKVQRGATQLSWDLK